jgi:hypothetical protein
MIKGQLMNNTKIRRKGSMLQDNLSKIKYLFMFAVLLVLPMLVLPMNATSSVLEIDQTDTGSERIIAFWDTRDRDSFIQVTNTSSTKITIHVQIFDVNSQFQTECEECNFDDMLTGFDTHVYNIKDIVTNFDPEVRCAGVGLDGSYGFMVISSRPDNVSSPLIGMFRIIDGTGYEYRANAAGEDQSPFFGDNNTVNFSDANGNNLSDLVGITYIATPDPGQVEAGPGIQTVFGSFNNQIFIYDDDEDAQSCSPTTFACKVGFLDKGIDNALPNSKGQANRVCATAVLDSNIAGWLHMPFDKFVCPPPFGDANGVCLGAVDPMFVGFVGLNNGDGTGSMDSWWTQSRNVFN